MPTPPDPVVLAVFMGAFGCIVLAMLYVAYTLPPDDERWELLVQDDYDWWRNRFQ